MNVVVVDKSALQRLGLSKIIGEKLENATIDAIEEIPETPAGHLPGDLVVLGLPQSDLPEGNLRLLEAVFRRYPQAPVLVFESVQNRRSFKNLVAYLKAGIKGYVTTLDSLEVIGESLKKVLSGNRYISQDALEWLLDRLLSGRADLTNVLTPNELDVAAQLLEGCSVSQIARETNRTVSTISTIKRSILRKTNADNIFKLGEVLNLEKALYPVKFRNKPLPAKRTRSWSA